MSNPTTNSFAAALEIFRVAVLREAEEAARRAAREELARLPHPASPAPPSPEVKYARIPAYARRVGLSTRKVRQLLDQGLPNVGRGALRRVDVAAGDAWIERHLREQSKPWPRAAEDDAKPITSDNAA